jgi:hypothetical protein
MFSLVSSATNAAPLIVTTHPRALSTSVPAPIGGKGLARSRPPPDRQSHSRSHVGPRRLSGPVAAQKREMVQQNSCS